MEELKVLLHLDEPVHKDGAHGGRDVWLQAQVGLHREVDLEPAEAREDHSRSHTVK